MANRKPKKPKVKRKFTKPVVLQGEGVGTWILSAQLANQLASHDSKPMEFKWPTRATR